MGKTVKKIAGIAIAFVAAAYLGPGALGFLLRSAALSGVSSLLTQKRRNGSLSAGTQVEYGGTVEPRRIIYGQALVAGMNVIPPWCSGTKNDLLHQVLALAGHEVDAITDVYLNQTLVASANIGAVSGTLDDGLVTTGDYANKIRIRRYTGTSTQTVDYILDQAFTAWTSNHRGRGVAYVALQYTYDTTVYRNGKPEVRALVRGKKVYDPRLDSTNGGSGSHRLATPSTWAYSNNPALCLADYLIDNSLGLGESDTRIDWALVAAAANVCDETVSIPSSTQKRYTLTQCVLECTTPYEDVIEQLAGAMLGSCVYSGGKWRMWAGKSQTSAFTITDDDVVGSIEFATAPAYRDRWNAVRGQYIDTANLYQPAEYPVVRVTGDETADGEGPVWKEVNFPFCGNVYEAQRNAIILQKLSRRKKSWTLQCAWTAFKIRPGEWGTLTLAALGISGQVVKCVSWRFQPDGMVSLSLDEAATADWNDPSTGTYSTPGAPTTPTPTSMKPNTPTDLSTFGGRNTVMVVWKPPDNAVPGTTYQVFEHSAATPFSSAVAVGPRTTQSNITLQRTSTTVAYFWVVAYFPNGQDSSAFVPSTGVAGAALSVDTGFYITVSPGFASKVTTASSGTTGTVTVTPTNAAGAVTHTWTRISGDASTTISSSSSATPTFSRTGMAVDTSYSSVWQVSSNDTVTTKTYDVSVTITRVSSL